MLFISSKNIIFGIVISVIYLILEATVDTFLFQTNNLFLQELFTPDFHEFLMRFIVIFLIMFISITTQHFNNKQKEIKNNLEEQKEFFSNIFKSIQDGIFIIDKDFRIISTNPKVEYWFKDKKPIIGKKCYNLLANRVYPCEVCDCDNLFSSQEMYQERTIELISNRKKLKVFNILNFPLKDQESGQVKGIIKYLRDVTKHKQAEEKLQESEEKYRILIETMTDGLCIIDKNGKFTYVNLSFYNMIGYSSEEILDTHVYDYLDKKNQSIVEKQLIKRRRGEKQPYLLMWTRKDGQKVHTIMAPKALIDTEGKYIGSFAVITNITERIIAEQRLKESEEKYRDLYENSPNAILLVNMKGEIVDCNSATEMIFQFNKQELIGKNSLAHFAIPQEYISIAINNLNSLNEGIIPEPQEIRLITKDKKPIWISHQISMVKSKNENLIQVLITDITSLKKAEELIKKELEKLKELDEIKNDLIQRIAHELRTPLTSIYSGSEFLLNYCKDKNDNKTQKILNIINAGGQRLKELVDNLMLAFEIESDNLKLQLQNSDLIFIVEQSIKEVSPLASQRKVWIHNHLHDNLYFTIDSTKIKKVLLNLLFNAVQNTQKNGSVYIRTKNGLNYMEISIEDTGVGFTEAEKKNLFKKFGKIERYGKGMDVNTEGPGLGLFNARKIVELHGGKIWVESEGRNKGSKFLIRLPVKN